MAWNHKKAEELKLAGFPQECPHGENYFVWVKNHIHVPSLYELITACGDGFFSLGRDGDKKWRAVMEIGEEVYRTDIDDDPMEAVANLWLILAGKGLVKIVQVIK